MSTCSGCGKDHGQQLSESFPEMFLFEKAFKWAQTKEADEIFSEALQRWVMSEVEGNQTSFIMRVVQSGQTSQEAVSAFTINMALMGFAVGVSLSEHYRHMIPALEFDEEERQQFVDERNDALKAVLAAQENLPGKDKIMEALKEAGILPPDFDGEISVQTIEVPESASPKTDPPTGMYL